MYTTTGAGATHTAGAGAMYSTTGAGAAITADERTCTTTLTLARLKQQAATY